MTDKTAARDLALLMATELKRQGDLDSWGAGYVSFDESDLDCVRLDGEFDLMVLAQALIDGRSPLTGPVPGIVTGIPDGNPVTWSEYLHKDWMLNMNQRLHHRPKNDRTQLVKTMAKARHRHLGKYRRAKLDIIISYPARFSADVHNYMPTAKAYVDGLIDIPDTGKGVKKQPARGIMIDDSDAYLAGPFLHPGIDKSDRKDHFRLDCILQPTK